MSTTRNLTLGWAAEAFPKAEKFRDYRKLLDQANTFDAVSVSTPDFMHAPISLAAMSLGKHVFCQKPLAHTVHEVRLMEESAKKHKLVTQMGNQIQAHHAYRECVCSSFTTGRSARFARFTPGKQATCGGCLRTRCRSTGDPCRRR